MAQQRLDNVVVLDLLSTQVETYLEKDEENEIRGRDLNDQLDEYNVRSTRALQRFIALFPKKEQHLRKVQDSEIGLRKKLQQVNEAAGSDEGLIVKFDGLQPPVARGDADAETREAVELGRIMLHDALNVHGYPEWVKDRDRVDQADKILRNPAINLALLTRVDSNTFRTTHKPLKTVLDQEIPDGVTGEDTWRMDSVGQLILHLSERVQTAENNAASEANRAAKAERDVERERLAKSMQDQKHAADLEALQEQIRDADELKKQLDEERKELRGWRQKATDNEKAYKKLSLETTKLKETEERYKTLRNTTNSSLQQANKKISELEKEVDRVEKLREEAEGQAEELREKMQKQGNSLVEEREIRIDSLEYSLKQAESDRRRLKNRLSEISDAFLSNMFAGVPFGDKILLPFLDREALGTVLDLDVMCVRAYMDPPKTLCSRHYLDGIWKSDWRLPDDNAEGVAMQLLYLISKAGNDGSISNADLEWVERIALPCVHGPGGRTALSKPSATAKCLYGFLLKTLFAPAVPSLACAMAATAIQDMLHNFPVERTLFRNYEIPHLWSDRLREMRAKGGLTRLKRATAAWVVKSADSYWEELVMQLALGNGFRKVLARLGDMSRYASPIDLLAELFQDPDIDSDDCSFFVEQSNWEIGILRDRSGGEVVFAKRMGSSDWMCSQKWTAFRHEDRANWAYWGSVDEGQCITWRDRDGSLLEAYFEKHWGPFVADARIVWMAKESGIEVTVPTFAVFT